MSLQIAVTLHPCAVEMVALLSRPVGSGAIAIINSWKIQVGVVGSY